MKIIQDIFTNQMILVPAAAWLISQIIKMAIDLIVYRKFSIDRLFGDGGMPSGHSATVVALMITVGWTVGFGSAPFAIAGVLAIIVMNDAMGVRRETGKHAVSIMKLADTLNKAFLSRDNEIKTENLKVLVGHTPLQVFFGAVTGFVVSVGYILIFCL